MLSLSAGEAVLLLVGFAAGYGVRELVRVYDTRSQISIRTQVAGIENPPPGAVKSNLATSPAGQVGR